MSLKDNQTVLPFSIQAALVLCFWNLSHKYVNTYGFIILCQLKIESYIFYLDYLVQSTFVEWYLERNSRRQIQFKFGNKRGKVANIVYEWRGEIHQT